MELPPHYIPVDVGRCLEKQVVGLGRGKSDLSSIFQCLWESYNVGERCQGTPKPS